MTHKFKEDQIKETIKNVTADWDYVEWKIWFREYRKT